MKSKNTKMEVCLLYFKVENGKLVEHYIHYIKSIRVWPNYFIGDKGTVLMLEKWENYR